MTDSQLFGRTSVLEALMKMSEDEQELEKSLIGTNHIDTPKEVLQFVDCVRFTSLEMLRTYLPKCIPDYQLKKTLNILFRANKIYVDWAKKTIWKRGYYPDKMSPNDTKVQNRITRAAWLLAYFGADNIRYAHCAGYPVQFKFVTGDREIGCDVTVINQESLTALQTLLPKYWAENLPEGIADTFTHFAVVPNENWDGFPAFIRKVKKIGFHLYVTIDNDTHDVVIHRFPEGD